MKIQIVNKSQFPVPEYATPASAGVDLRANVSEPITLGSLERILVPTGLFLAIPEGYEAQVRPRSGLAAKRGITVLNAPGTVDADYRGEVKVILVNLSKEDFIIEPGERIAQLVIAKHEKAEWNEVDKLDETERGEGGFGSTGTGLEDNNEILIFEYDPKQRCFHFNFKNGKDTIDAVPYSHGWIPLLITRYKDTATKEFDKMNNNAIKIANNKKLSIKDKIKEIYEMVKPFENNDLKKLFPKNQAYIDNNLNTKLNE